MAFITRSTAVVFITTKGNRLPHGTRLPARPRSRRRRRRSVRSNFREEPAMPSSISWKSDVGSPRSRLDDRASFQPSSKRSRGARPKQQACENFNADFRAQLTFQLILIHFRIEILFFELSTKVYCMLVITRSHTCSILLFDSVSQISASGNLVFSVKFLPDLVETQRHAFPNFWQHLEN